MNYLVAVDDCFIDSPGGMGRVAWDCALLMRDRGHRVTLFCLDRLPPGAARPTECEGVRIVRYQRRPVASWHPRKLGRAIADAAQHARAELSSSKWDVVHIHSPITGAGVQSALGEGPRYIYTMHSPIVLEQRINWANQGWVGRLKQLLGVNQLKSLEQNVLLKCVAIQTLSNFTRNEIAVFHGLENRVTVIPHWRRPNLKRVRAKEEARKRLGWRTDIPALFTLRVHGPRYGIDDAIQAIGPLTQANRCHFYIGGDGPLRGSFERLSRDSGFSGGITFLGRLSDQDLLLAYEAADLFILPTRALECFGLITVEALSFGCPVLSTDAGAIPETMTPVLPQFIVPAGDVAAMRNKVQEYLDGKLIPPPPAVLERYVASRFDEEIIVPKLIAFMEGNA